MAIISPHKPTGSDPIGRRAAGPELTVGASRPRVPRPAPRATPSPRLLAPSRYRRTRRAGPVTGRCAAGDAVWLSYSVRTCARGRTVSSGATDGPVLVRLGQGLLPLGLELAVASRMGLNSSARCDAGRHYGVGHSPQTDASNTTVAV